MHLSRACLTSGFAAILVTASWSCRDATEIRLIVRTNMDCTSAWQGVAIYTGQPGIDVLIKPPTVVTASCQAVGNGQYEIGTLVVVPSGANDEALAIRVVAGITTAPLTCATVGNQGCVESIWTGRFTSHQSVDVAVNLDSACIGINCDLTHSCFRGSCGEAVATMPVIDAGPKSVYCGGVMCRSQDPGSVCCLNVTGGVATGTCGSASACKDKVILCDDESDCPGRDDAGGPMICCGLGDPNQPISGTQCLTVDECHKGRAFVTAMCQDRSGCLDHTTLCRAEGRLPGYFSCVL